MKGKKNIVLVGFMGTGKSAVGQIVAHRLGLNFFDMDTLIEQRAGKPIPRIFAEDGEAYFRQLERAMVQELAARDNLVVAPGGGIVLNGENIRDFSRSGVVICLRAQPETILARVGHEVHRPLLQGGDKLQKIREILGRRQAHYDAIPKAIDTDGLTPEQVADRVISFLNEPS